MSRESSTVLSTPAVWMPKGLIEYKKLVAANMILSELASFAS